MSRLTKKKMEQQLDLGVVLWLICFAMLLCGAGVGVCVIKNRQINVQRDMQRMLVEINSCEKMEEYYRHKITSNTSRWDIQDRLVQNGSKLIDIDLEQVRNVRAERDRIVASTK